MVVIDATTMLLFLHPKAKGPTDAGGNPIPYEQVRLVVLDITSASIGSIGGGRATRMTTASTCRTQIASSSTSARVAVGFMPPRSPRFRGRATRSCRTWTASTSWGESTAGPREHNLPCVSPPTTCTVSPLPSGEPWRTRSGSGMNWKMMRRSKKHCDAYVKRIEQLEAALQAVVDGRGRDPWGWCCISTSAFDRARTALAAGEPELRCATCGPA